MIKAFYNPIIMTDFITSSTFDKVHTLHYTLFKLLIR